MPPVHYRLKNFPPRDIEWSRLIPLLGPTAAAVARYDGMLAAVPNPAVLLAPLTTPEAVLSSKIEGTQATMGEVLEFEAGGEPESATLREDIHEVLQYRAAMREAERLLGELPFSLRVLRGAHAVLLDGVRGQSKSPGEFRRGQAWIGPPECSIDQAKYVAAEPDHLAEFMAAWERYANDAPADRLVQTAVLHAEFEAVHPFADGNGRLGRLLIPLFLAHVGIIRRPMFYVSAYLEAHRAAYYDRLLAVSRDGDWTGWCEFFLEAIRSQAVDNLAKASAILDLFEAMKRRLPELTRSQHAVLALDWIFERPIFSSVDFVGKAGIPEATARRFLRLFEAEGVLRAVAAGSGRRPTIFGFPALLEIVEGRPLS
jgi:Fic family protein